MSILIWFLIIGFAACAFGLWVAKVACSDEQMQRESVERGEY